MKTKDKRIKLADGRERMIEAAEDIVRRQGMEGLSIGAVAKSVGLTKGGVLHHFKTKDELVAAMMRRDFERFLASYEKHCAQIEGLEDPLTSHQKDFLPYFRAVVHDAESADMLRLCLSVAAVLDPRHQAETRASLVERWHQLDPDDDREMRLAVAKLVADGLWINTLLGTGPPEAVKARLERFLLDSLGE
ncbi:MAG: TetR/AcrR family transcriptional regulator [Pseudomonadota bacterium]